MRRGNVKKFGRVRNQRRALHKALITALVEHGKIKTTLAKAKTLAKLTDSMVTKARKGDVASRRLIGSYLGDKATTKLVKELSERFKDKNGGYTKVLKLGRRMSDGAEMAIVEWSA